MADFKIAVLLTLKHEGGYVDDPLDPGGRTNMGITQKDLPDIDIRTLTVAQAVAYYSANYWKALYSQINDQSIANKLFDLGVLFGVRTAVKYLQIAVNTGVDGSFGPTTLDAVNQADSVSLLQDYKTALIQRAESLVVTNPKLQKFLKGWTSRINS